MILVVGSQRTGSTLMSMIIGAHPKTNLIGDIDLANIIDGKYRRNDVLHAVVWTARHNLINKYYPNNRYIFMLRDLRAVVSSMLEIDWAKRYALQESVQAIGCLPDWRKQYEIIAYLGRIYREGNPVEMATLCAYLKSYYLILYHQCALNVFPVRYKTLVRSPQSTMEMVLDFLDLPWNDSVLQYYLLSDEKEMFGNDPKRSIDTASINKWRTKLRQADLDAIHGVSEYLDAIFDGFSKEYFLRED